MGILKSIFYFVLAGIFEIGGGYLVWLWLRDGKSLWWNIYSSFNSLGVENR